MSFLFFRLTTYYRHNQNLAYKSYIDKYMILQEFRLQEQSSFIASSVLSYGPYEFPVLIIYVN